MSLGIDPKVGEERSRTDFRAPIVEAYILNLTVLR
jgi:hypothetical protein